MKLTAGILLATALLAAPAAAQDWPDRYWGSRLSAEIRREVREALRDARLASREAMRETSREAARARRDAWREAARARRDSWRHYWQEHRHYHDWSY